ncbi:MAG: DUF61 family protein [Desulfurococcales archaeon]|nr:DUF61 family protein [Desulfurococcales archaeon]
MNKGLEKRIIAKYRRDAARLSALLPQSRLTIEDLNRGERRIQLYSGDEHIIDDEEARKIISLVPPYFWRLMSVPIILKYIKYSDGTRKYLVMGDIWQKRLVEILVTGDYTSQGLEELEVEDFTRLLSKYKTIIFVTITL